MQPWLRCLSGLGAHTNVTLLSRVTKVLFLKLALFLLDFSGCNSCSSHSQEAYSLEKGIFSSLWSRQDCPALLGSRVYVRGAQNAAWELDAAHQAIFRGSWGP